jgi:hypothetical protein
MLKMIFTALLGTAGFGVIILAGVAGSSYLSQKEFERKEPVREQYKLIEGTFSTTSKIGTVLPIKTMFRINIETGETVYMLDNAWNIVQ